MRIVVTISGPTVEELGRALYDKMIAAAVPLSEDNEYPWWRGYGDSDTVAALLGLLQAHGFSEKKEIGRSRVKGREYQVNRWREYSKEDLDACELLFPCVGVDSSVDLDDVVRTKSGLLRVVAREAKREAKNFRNCELTLAGPIGCMVVPDRVKVRLESAGLLGLVFKPVLVSASSQQEKAVPWAEAGVKCDPLWELSSEQLMPPLPPEQRVEDSRGRELFGSDRLNKFVSFADPDFTKTELKYRRADLRAHFPVMPDVARTVERVSPYAEEDGRIVVVSARFRRVWEEFGFRCEWTPVRII